MDWIGSHTMLHIALHLTVAIFGTSLSDLVNPNVKGRWVIFVSCLSSSVFAMLPDRAMQREPT